MVGHRRRVSANFLDRGGDEADLAVRAVHRHSWGYDADPLNRVAGIGCPSAGSAGPFFISPSMMRHQQRRRRDRCRTAVDQHRFQRSLTVSAFGGGRRLTP